MDYYEGLAISYLLAIGIVSLIVCVVCGKVSENIAINKGYGASSKTYFWLGFFLTFIGILIISFQPDQAQVKQNQRMNNANDLLKYKKLLDEGAITEEEFRKIKNKLL